MYGIVRTGSWKLTHHTFLNRFVFIWRWHTHFYLFPSHYIFHENGMDDTENHSHATATYSSGCWCKQTVNCKYHKYTHTRSSISHGSTSKRRTMNDITHSKAHIEIVRVQFSVNMFCQHSWMLSLPLEMCQKRNRTMAQSNQTYEWKKNVIIQNPRRFSVSSFVSFHV